MATHASIHAIEGGAWQNTVRGVTKESEDWAPNTHSVIYKADEQ